MGYIYTYAREHHFLFLRTTGVIVPKLVGSQGFTCYEFYGCYGWSTSTLAHVRTLFPYLSNCWMYHLEFGVILRRTTYAFYVVHCLGILANSHVQLHNLFKQTCPFALARSFPKVVLLVDTTFGCLMGSNLMEDLMSRIKLGNSPNVWALVRVTLLPEKQM